MKVQMAQQASELMTYLGVCRYGTGRQCLDRCFVEMENGACPGMETYEKAAHALGITAAQVVMQSQRALNRARKKYPRKWEELFPALDVERIGLALFLCHAAEWLRKNRIGTCRRGHEKYRMPLTKM